MTQWHEERRTAERAWDAAASWLEIEYNDRNAAIYLLETNPYRPSGVYFCTDCGRGDHTGLECEYDYCTRCEARTRWNGEECTEGCGKVWGARIMQAMTMTKVRDLKEGDLVDVEPALDWLANEGHSIDPIDRGLATMELTTVASVESLPPETPYELGILNNHLADYIAALHVEGSLPSMYVPDTLELPRVLRD